MKKFFVLILVLTLALALAACGKTGAPDTTAPTDAPDTTAADVTSPAATDETAEPTKTPDAGADETEAADPTDATEETESQTEHVWEAATLTVQWAEDVPDLTNEIGVILSEDEPISRAVIFTDKAVRDFKALALTDPGFTDDDKLVFTAAERYALGVLEPEQPILLTLTFYGDLPSWGVSYVDETGATRVFAVDMSGMDGSAVLTEITVR